MTDELAQGLPEGWAESTMGEIATVVGGGTPKVKDEKNFASGGYALEQPASESVNNEPIPEKALS